MCVNPPNLTRRDQTVTTTTTISAMYMNVKLLTNATHVLSANLT